MISYNRFRLNNGLTVIHHLDTSTPMVALNILYNVGARDEDPGETGFAHLFEHLMFGGSVNIPEYDAPLQLAGGENNAFTSNDITNYYVVVPANNIETALWLESDRMMSLDFTEKSLAVQKGVVVEEFRQRYLNQPYGDAWLNLRPLAYTQHPYRWATIGKEPAHIENATLDSVKAFFSRFYHPANAILCMAGNITLAETERLVKKWFGDLEGRTPNPNLYPAEPPQTGRRFLEIHAEVPQDAIYMAWHMGSRMSSGFYAADLLSDLLSRGNASILYNRLVKEQALFSDINAYIIASHDPGLMVVEGRANPGVSHETAEAAVWETLGKFLQSGPDKQAMQREKNKTATSRAFQVTGALNKAMELCLGENLGDPDLINRIGRDYEAVTADEALQQANSILRPENCSVIHYKKS